MADKDKIEKLLEDYNDVFADILNVLLFEQDFIKEEQLEDGPIVSIYKEESKGLRDQYRDIAKYYKDAGLVIFECGMENESEIDKDMPIRLMGYDYSSYRRQIDKGNRRFPVITIVLNFSDRRWLKPLCLKDILEIPDGMDKYVQDYKINVFDIAYLSDETIDRFKSTFKHVAHFFKNKCLKEDYKPLNEEIKHLGAFLDFLKIFTGDRKYEEVKSELIERQKKGQVVTMCTVVERFTNEGIQQGIQKNQEQIIVNMHKENCNVDTISKLTGISLETVRKTLEKNGYISESI